MAVPICSGYCLAVALLEPPQFTPEEYGRLLDRDEFWRPYAEAAFRRSGWRPSRLESGFPGTYPTLVGDTAVVKLFGHFGDWRQRYIAEVAANRAIDGDDRIRAPRVLATGELFPGREDNWPFLLMERLPGVAWRDANLDPAGRLRIARVLGEHLRAVHDLPLPQLPPSGDALAGSVPDWLSRQRAGVVERHRRWGTLPAPLIDQLDEFLADLMPGRSCLVHGDVTEDHVFLADGHFTGLIDWGDAVITDPYYDLAALHLGTFGADRRLLTAFLEGYGWEVEACFVRRAMQAALLHEFDVLADVRAAATTAPTLDDLAHRLWQPDHRRITGTAPSRVR